MEQESMSLEDKADLARREFAKSKEGDLYLIGYSFPSRRRHGPCGSRTDVGKRIVIDKSGEIRISPGRLKDDSGKKENAGITTLGILFLNRMSKNRDELLDVKVMGLDTSYKVKDGLLFWLGKADTEESIRFLKMLFETAQKNIQRVMTFAIGQHDSPRSSDFLMRVAIGDYDREIRKNAVFWLGQAKDRRSLETLIDISRRKLDLELKNHVVFTLQLSDDKAAVEELIRIAGEDECHEIRRQALFWLGQKATRECSRALKDVVGKEKENMEVRKMALFAINRLPKDEAASILIDVVRTNKSPALKKKAVFLLSRIDTKAALGLFEEILLSRDKKETR